MEKAEAKTLAEKKASMRYYHCAKDAKRAVSRCRLERVPAGDIEKVVLEQLSAVFRTPTLVSRTYFAAKGMEDAGRERLLKRKERLEDDLLKVRERALEEGTLDGHRSDPGPALVELNREAVTLSRQLMDVSARAGPGQDLTHAARRDAGQLGNLPCMDALIPEGQHELAARLVEVRIGRHPQQAREVLLNRAEQLRRQHVLGVGVSAAHGPRVFFFSHGG